MLFNSLVFVVFATVFFLIFGVVRKKVQGRLVWLTIASFFFYVWWDWRFLFLIIFSGLVDYYAALGMVKFPKRKKLLLLFSVLANVGSLSVFKYSGFFAANIDALFGLHGSFSLVENIPGFFLITPVGISFYTFQSMSYTIDVYREKLKPTKRIIHFFAYLSMFPQLVAGPIVRAKSMLPQLLTIPVVTKEQQWTGFQLIVRGYFFKMVIADNLAPLVVAAFGAPEVNSSSLFWWGTIIAFTFQIYCDFAGYTAIARGLARWMGYEIPVNFDHPYISTSISEFWTRWHISLSTWFRDYVYIPLGGNQKGMVRKHVNLWITMLVSGLWHGAAWTFVVWGAVHAFFASFEHITRWPEKLGVSLPAKLLAWFFVSLQGLVASVFFRAQSIQQAWEIVRVMFSFQGKLNPGWGLDGAFFILLIVVREIFAASGRDKQLRWKYPIAEMIFYAILIVMIIFLRGEGSEFIYFQF